jgi:hypothetical protein
VVWLYPGGKNHSKAMQFVSCPYSRIFYWMKNIFSSKQQAVHLPCTIQLLLLQNLNTSDNAWSKNKACSFNAGLNI